MTGWSGSLSGILSSGVPVIDYEHAELITQLMRLKEESSEERIRQMLEFLADYVVRHFAHEQMMHKELGYPKAAAHRAAHEGFVQSFLALEKEYFDGCTNPEFLGRFIAAMETWLQHHILGEDMEFAEFYQRVVPQDVPVDVIELDS
ncbi:MAG: hemerythrin family protein [Planctomycetes bacterium]|nr:hemerythrin family protein [Planctomycetota bacterium]